MTWLAGSAIVRYVWSIPRGVCAYLIRSALSLSANIPAYQASGSWCAVIHLLSKRKTGMPMHSYLSRHILKALFLNADSLVARRDRSIFCMIMRTISMHQLLPQTRSILSVWVARQTGSQSGYRVHLSQRGNLRGYRDYIAFSQQGISSINLRLFPSNRIRVHTSINSEFLVIFLWKSWRRQIGTIIPLTFPAHYTGNIFLLKGNFAWAKESLYWQVAH